MTGTIPDFYADKMAQAFQESEYQRILFTAFNGLKGELKKDGNQWCAITGQMPENYIAGFGNSPHIAMMCWYTEFSTPIKTITP